MVLSPSHVESVLPKVILIACVHKEFEAIRNNALDELIMIIV